MSPPDLHPVENTSACEEVNHPREVNYLTVGLLVGLLVGAVVGLLWISPDFLPDADPDRLYRATIQRLLTDFGGLLIIVSGLLIVDLMTPGRWLKRILNDTRAIAAVVVVIIYCLMQLHLG